MVLSETVGQRIRRLRRAKQRALGRKYRRGDLAEEVDVSPQQLGAWEEDREVPGPDEYHRLASALGVSAAFIAKGKAGQVANFFPGVAPPLSAQTPSILEAIGSALWVVQSLDETMAVMIVWLITGYRGMGAEAGEQETAKAREVSMGAKLGLLEDALELDPDFLTAAKAVVAARNWLVHNSWLEYGQLVRAVGSDTALRVRLDKLEADCNRISRIVVEAMDQEHFAHGITREELEAMFLEEVKKRYS